MSRLSHTLKIWPMDAQEGVDIRRFAGDQDKFLAVVKITTLGDDGAVACLTLEHSTLAVCELCGKPYAGAELASRGVCPGCGAEEAAR